MDKTFFALFGATFLTVFIAELGDKTQLAAAGLAATSRNPWAVFLGGSVALIASTALAVVLGSWLSDRLDPRWLHYGGACLFLLIGIVMLARGPE
jgi:putative Ca2+/H+ antiporter (TMEM165/GDT1 family)